MYALLTCIHFLDTPVIIKEAVAAVAYIVQYVYVGRWRTFRLRRVTTISYDWCAIKSDTD
jgi:hypothetical protein